MNVWKKQKYRCQPPSLLLDIRGGMKGVQRQEKRVKISAIPRLVKFLDFGLHFRHEGAERALASCKRKAKRSEALR